MPFYDVACPEHGVLEVYCRASAAASEMPCPVCNAPSPQVFHAFAFQEDRTRFWRGPSGSRYSYALGENMPETRGERDRLCREKGIEFVGKREMPDTWKRAVEYRQHVDTGGERLDPKVVAPKEPVKVESILEKVRRHPEKFRRSA